MTSFIDSTRTTSNAPLLTGLQNGIEPLYWEDFLEQRGGVVSTVYES